MFEKTVLDYKKSDISVNYVNKIIEDKNGTLWIGTRNGLFKSKKGTLKFVECDLIDEKNNEIRIQVFSLFEDSAGDLWIGTSSGVLKYNTGN